MWKMQEIKPDKNNFFGRKKVSEAECKRDWHNVRSYLFFHVRQFQTQCAMALIIKWLLGLRDENYNKGKYNKGKHIYI